MQLLNSHFRPKELTNSVQKQVMLPEKILKDELWKLLWISHCDIYRWLMIFYFLFSELESWRLNYSKNKLLKLKISNE